MANNIARNIRFLRKTHNETQKDVGMIVNKAISTIEGWEHGWNEPRIDDLIKIANYYKLTLDELVRDDLKGRNLTRELKIQIRNAETEEEQIELLNELLRVKREYAEGMNQ